MAGHESPCNGERSKDACEHCCSASPSDEPSCRPGQEAGEDARWLKESCAASLEEVGGGELGLSGSLG